MDESGAVYSAAAVTAREKARRRRQRNRVAGAIIGIGLIAGNVCLVVWRAEVIEWVRARFGSVEVVIERKR